MRALAARVGSGHRSSLSVSRCTQPSACVAPSRASSAHSEPAGPRRACARGSRLVSGATAPPSARAGVRARQHPPRARLPRPHPRCTRDIPHHTIANGGHQIDWSGTGKLPRPRAVPHSTRACAHVCARKGGRGDQLAAVCAVEHRAADCASRARASSSRAPRRGRRCARAGARARSTRSGGRPAQRGGRVARGGGRRWASGRRAPGWRERCEGAH